MQAAEVVAAGYVAPALSIVGSDRDQNIDDAIAHAVSAGSDVDDDIDAIDVIDPDLFPIFEEEAAELLPQLGGALRQWASRPDNLGARNEVLRALHTLKGSSRLAGAMRLGEMSHRLESAIEQLDMETVTVSPKFQVVIPLAVRQRMKLQPGAKLMVVEFNGGLRLVPLQPAASLRGIARGIDPQVLREPDRAL